MALGILAHTDIRNCSGPDDVQSLHFMFEAMKLAFRDSAAFVADPAFMTHVTATQLLEPDYLASRAALIDPGKALILIVAHHARVVPFVCPPRMPVA
jgi:gamma-glutamyltranspeptidase/glutathione hydrolase